MSKRTQKIQLRLQLPAENPVKLEPEVERELVMALADLLLAVAKDTEDVRGDTANEQQDQ